jgi:tRNA pseudouridine55 synthase
MAFGLLNIDKPAGPTSHDIVQRVRRGTGERRIGHAGTLDPMASGVLILVLGQATRLAEYLTASQKAYRAVVTVGVATDTYDAEGTVVEEKPLPDDFGREMVEAALEGFRGPLQQIPPVYSAIKVGGRPAYDRVRSGEKVELKPRSVEIYDLRLTAFEPPAITIELTCSAGTYVRSLAHDLGKALECVAMLSELERTASGRFTIAEAVSWPVLEAGFADGSWERYLLPADLALSGAPKVMLDAEGLTDVSHGRTISAQPVTDGVARAYAPDGRFVAVLQGEPGRGHWQPKKVFVTELQQ